MPSTGWFVGLVTLALVAFWLGRRSRRGAAVAGAPSAPSGSAFAEAEADLSHMEVVGESHWQENLERLAGGRTEDGADLLVKVTLRPDPGNVHDANAVIVEVDELQVGFLSRESAKEYRAAFGGAIVHDYPARIVGGWDRGGGDSGSFGVKLEE